MLKALTPENFKKYGRIIEYPKRDLKAKKRNLWKVILVDKFAKGWRIAYLIVRNKAIKRLERHPFTYESFEPISGKALLLVSRGASPQMIDSFRLSKPVILKKGIWHGVVSISLESDIKITENAKVQCQFWQLPTKLPKRHDR